MKPKRLRQLLLMVIVALLAIGTVTVYSASAMASEANYGGTLRFVGNHLLSIACGMALGIASFMVPYATLRRSARWLFVAGLLSLVLVCLFGQEAGGARRWFYIGRWSVQPSEFAQLSLVVYMADLLARRIGKLDDFWRGLLPPLVATGLMAWLVLIQPDLGTDRLLPNGRRLWVPRPTAG